MRWMVASAILSASVGSVSAVEMKCPRITVVVPYTAGGATDVASRLVASAMEPLIKKSIVIETRTGATGNIGTAYVATSPPDGCTLLVNGAVMATYAHSFKKLSYDPIKDLVAVGSIGVTPTMLVTSNKEMKNVQDLIAWSKRRPDGLSYGSAGYGLLHHLAVEEIAEKTKSRLVHVPYRGGGSATIDLTTGRLDFGSFAFGSVVSFTNAGSLQMIAVLQDKRSPLAPNVPSISEQGFPGLDAGIHFMMFAPSATPKHVVDYLSDTLAKVVADPSLTQRFAAIGFDPIPLNSREAGEIVQKTGADWAPVIKRLNIALD
ncbi:MAG: tripartite tricarboxylate transporter substrate binding protein [Beijerinckiaceae bacterium]|nr:tripartite tricarboxylate transporter substrate binding protein [Beijerinckiaceae bacterium]